MKKSKECPNCRNTVKAVKKNPIINSIITQYLDVKFYKFRFFRINLWKGHPEKLRTKEEYLEMDQKNKITCDLVMKNKLN